MNDANVPVVWVYHPEQAIVPAGQASPPAPVCPSLPSSNSAYNFLCGKPGSFLHLARDLAVRGALIGTGLWIYDRFKDPDDRRSLGGVFADGLAGSAMIEAFVLIWISQTAASR